MPSFAEIRDALGRAQELPANERAAFMASLVPELRREVESLLAEAEGPAHIVETGALAEGLGAELAGVLDAASSGRLPERVGPYRTLKILGEGGMGTVYAGEHIETGRRVALKLIRRGMDTDRIVARFEAERRALVMMSHRSIAAVYDAGADAAGRPWFAMELVEGEPLHAYCDRKRLTLQERMRLFLEVCDAVQHAHRKGIVHRDLKPSNLLVVDIASGPQLKVIDFGIARALSATQGDEARLTAAGQFLGTPEYMSPEQAGAFGGRVDERADVFGLGAVLHELLVGVLPRDLNTKSVIDVLVALRETDPELPSRRFQAAEDQGVDVQALSFARGCTPDMLLRQLEGDIDRLVVKALQRDPQARYASVQALAADIGRFLVGARVHAAGDTLSLRTEAGTAHNLPRTSSRLVGRSREAAEVIALLRRQRVVSLTGAGGSGKTRLAIRVAEAVLSEFPSGVHFVDLSGVQAGERVAAVLAHLLGVQIDAEHSALDGVTRALHGATALVVLDNCEHVLAEVASLVEAILAECADTRVLATSRETLNVAAEAVFLVPTLSVPDPGEQDLDAILETEAVRLFVDRASLVMPAFALDRRTGIIAADVCRRLDGIPLAIELAASRVNVLSLEELRSRLDDRFRLLTSRSRTVPPRHQTLRAAIEWSHQSLAPEEAVLFRRLAVFPGGWTLEGAEAVHAVAPTDESLLVLDVLSRLVDKSLVVVEQHRTEATRYRMLETVREFGSQQLAASGEEVAVRDGHLRFVVDFCQLAGEHLRSTGQNLWLRRVAPEQENVLSAMDWSLRPGAPAEPAVRIAASMWIFWWIRGHLDIGFRVLDRVRERDDPPSRIPARGELLRGLGAIALYYLTDKSIARTRIEESARLCESIGDRAGLGRALQALANVLVSEGDLDAAREHSLRALELAREEGRTRGIAAALNAQGEIERARGRFEAAVPFYAESADIALRHEDFDGASQVLLNLSMCFVSAGGIREASASLKRAMDIIREIDGRHAATDAFDVAAAAAHLAGDDERAGRWYGAAHALRERLGSGRDDADAPPHVHAEAEIVAAVGPERQRNLAAAGAAESFEAIRDEVAAWLNGFSP